MKRRGNCEMNLCGSPILLLVSFAVAVSFFSSVVSGATLAVDEVEALREIGKTLGKTDWNFDVDPCSGQSGWNETTPLSRVTCDCSSSSSTSNSTATVCHVISIILQTQNLAGTLPSALTKLPYLKEFDVGWNYLNGTIPPEWASLKLVNLSLMTNRLTGSIPKELGSISTLVFFSVEGNQLSGSIPSELGNLINLERLALNSNRFTGDLPSSFAKLTALRSFWISDNLLSGKIPDFIQNWSNLTTLFMHASGMDGPIPSSIGLLEHLVDLRISDLNGTSSSFPPLSNMKNLSTLILRHCNVTGKLPDYLAGLRNITNLDLSFNNLTGDVPTSYSTLSQAQHIYLTGNALTGDVPSWMLGGNYIDLSYNNFASGNSTSSCKERSVNLFGNYVEGNKSGIVPCLRTSTDNCPKTWYSFNINCGGSEFDDGNIRYEDDTNRGGPANFYKSDTNWAFSSTGHMWDSEIYKDQYTVTNVSIAAKSKLYMSARISPLSLTYYGFCLANGEYIVDLHFAEIIFTDDQTYKSLGRRVFNVYIQGKLELKDFDIVSEAGGVGKEIIKRIPVVVTENSLEIRFYWAGKGTVAVPDRSVYGPLVSAISANHKHKNSTPTGAIVGIVAAVFVVIVLAGFLWWTCMLNKQKREIELTGLDLQTRFFSLRQIKAATNDFDPANKLGEGGFGSVYKGLLPDGSIIAVKQLSSTSKQGNREFVNEIGMISSLQHPHLVKLHGCCIEENQLLLVYEYMENNCLGHALFGSKDCQIKLDWPTRHKICLGIARGLAYLHEESRLKIVHRDIKANNILLDKDLNAKISDFGLAKLDDEHKTHISTRIAGTFGYMAPEYAMRGHLTDKADVYSFGIVALEIISGRKNTVHKTGDDIFYLVDWDITPDLAAELASGVELIVEIMGHSLYNYVPVGILNKNGQLLDLVDPRLGSKFNRKEAMRMIKVALLCINESPAARPPMSLVASMLAGKTYVQEMDLEQGISRCDSKSRYDSESSVSKYDSESSASSNWKSSQEQSLIGSQNRTKSFAYSGSVTFTSDL